MIIPKKRSNLTTKALDGYRDEETCIQIYSNSISITIFASTDMSDVGDMSETKLTERQQKTLSLIKESPTISGRQMSEILSVSQRTIERDLSALQA